MRSSDHKLHFAATDWVDITTAAEQSKHRVVAGVSVNAENICMCENLEET